jgi:integrase
MNFVQPIRDPDIISEMEKYLIETNERNYIMFEIGVYMGLRISDILKLRVRHVKGTHINIRETKTRKEKKIVINNRLRKVLDKYIAGRADDEYLIQSRQGINRPIGRSMAYKALREVADLFSLENIGTHTLRKTFGYHYYKKNKDIGMLMYIFNHSSERVTLRYIGIIQDTIDDAMKNFRIT